MAPHGDLTPLRLIAIPAAPLPTSSTRIVAIIQEYCIGFSSQPIKVGIPVARLPSLQIPACRTTAPGSSEDTHAKRKAERNGPSVGFLISQGPGNLCYDAGCGFWLPPGFDSGAVAGRSVPPCSAEFFLGSTSTTEPSLHKTNFDPNSDARARAVTAARLIAANAPSVSVCSLMMTPGGQLVPLRYYQIRSTCLQAPGKCSRNYSSSW